MNILAFTIGLLVCAFVIWRFKVSKLERTRWAYPLLLASFPVYYFVFAAYGYDLQALGKEVVVAIPFMLFSYIAYQSKRETALLLVGTGCVLHAAYDVYHTLLFNNAGVPLWWVEFCGSVDVVLGAYLLYQAFFSIKRRKL